MNWKERWRLLPSDTKSGVRSSLLLMVLMALSLWSIEQHYANPTISVVSFSFFELVCIAVVVNSIIRVRQYRKQADRFWNPVTTVTFAGFMILFIMLILLFVIW